MTPTHSCPACRRLVPLDQTRTIGQIILCLECLAEAHREHQKIARARPVCNTWEWDT